MSVEGGRPVAAAQNIAVDVVADKIGGDFAVVKSFSVKSETFKGDRHFNGPGELMFFDGELHVAVPGHSLSFAVQIKDTASGIDDDLIHFLLSAGVKLKNISTESSSQM